MDRFKHVFEDLDKVTGQMIMAGFEGTSLPDEVREALREGRVGGLILFKRNVESPEQLRALTDSIRDAAQDPPAFIAIDQEGGRVSRLGPPFTQYAPARTIGEKDSLELARSTGEAMAEDLRAVGINLDFAPVLDVDSNPVNPIIGDRSFSSDPQKAARLGCAFIEGMRSKGVIPCGKHFPGHGDTSADSHKELPVVDVSREVLEQRELVPFNAAIQAEVPMLMTAHVKYPALDRYYPATLSEAIISKLLREKLGYKGVVIGDDLLMDAIALDTTIEDATYMAARAGVDLLMVCNEFDKAEQARQALATAVQTGALGTNRIAEAVERVLNTKEEFLLWLCLSLSDEA